MPKQIDFAQTTAKLKDFYQTAKRLPSFSELQNLLGYRSKSGVARVIAHLVRKNIVQQDTTGRLLPAPHFQGKLKLLGSIKAGFPSPAEEEMIDTISLDEFLIQKPEASYLVKVTGDSMLEAGIHPGDLVIVERGRTAKDGDIVIAQIDGEWTLKYYVKKGREVSLKAANRKYPPMQPKEELIIGGIVTACIRKYGR